MSKRKTQDEFIAEATKIYNGKYDYSESTYETAVKKLTVICRIHGRFLVTPNNHLSNKRGCPECAIEDSRLTQSEFIDRSMALYDAKYTYENTVYTNCRSHVVVTCPIHGDFPILPKAHLSGTGCTKCAIERRSLDKIKKSALEFASKATEIQSRYNRKFDYDKVVYVDSQIPVEIVCPIHGSFFQKPCNHLAGCGCEKCHIEGDKMLPSEFIEKAISLHLGRYTYEKSAYINTDTPVEITCQKHGSFMQLPRVHLRGHGCPVCRYSKGELKIAEYLDLRSIKYKKEKVFPTCTSGDHSHFRFDFHLTGCKILIEFHGKHHYDNVKYFHSNIETIERRDKIKDEWAKANGYHLIVIPYTDFDRIDEILTSELSGLQLSLF